MKYKFIKTFIIAVLCSSLNIAWFWTSEEEAQKKVLQNIDEAIKLSRAELFEGKTDEAIEILQKAYSDFGETKSLCEALAYAFSQSQQYSSAAIYFEKAFKLSENNVILLLNAGRSYEQCNALDSALAVYKKYLALTPNDANINKAAAIIYEKQAHYQNALNSYMEFVKNAGRNPNPTEACEIAKLFLKLKNIVQAKAWFTSALAACDGGNVELETEILAGLIDIALAESDMVALEKSQVELKKINAKFLAEKYPKLESDILAYKINLQEAKIALEETQRKEEEAQALEAKKLEEERLALEAKEKEEAELKAKEEAEILAKKEEEAKRLEEAKIAQEKELEEKQIQESSEIRAMLAPEAEVLVAEESLEAEEQAEETEPVQDEESQEAPVQEDLIAVPKTKIDSQIYEFQALMGDGDFAAAENLAQQIVADNPSSSRAWCALARAYQAQDMQIDAFLAAKQAQAKDKGDVKSALLRIQLGVGIESERAFLTNLLSADKAFPECPPVLLAIARTYDYLGKADESKAFYDKFFEFTSKKDPLYADVEAEMSSLGAARKLDIKTIAKDLEL